MINRDGRTHRPHPAIEKTLDFAEKIVTLAVVWAMVPLILYSAHRYNNINKDGRRKNEKNTR